MSEYSKRAAARDEAWKRLTDFLDSLWQGKPDVKLDPAKYRELRDAFAAAVTRVDELWSEGASKAFRD